MEYITIDSRVIVPPEDASPENMDSYIQQLHCCLNMHRELMSKVNVFKCNSAELAIWHDGGIQYEKRLKELDKCNTNYDSYSVRRLIQGIVDHTPSFQESFNIHLLEALQVSISPAKFAICEHPDIQNDIEQCLLAMVLLENKCDPHPGNHFFFSSSSDQSIISVSATIEDILTDREDLKSSLPIAVDGDVTVCNGIKGLVSKLDPSVILRNAKNDDEIMLAIKIARYQDQDSNEPNMEPEWKDIDKLRIGTDFRITALKLCDVKPPAFLGQLLRSIVETVESRNLDATHIVRTGPGGGDPARKRGGDTLIQRKINRSDRLHYWQGDNGYIELVSANVHDDKPN